MFAGMELQGRMVSLLAQTLRTGSKQLFSNLRVRVTVEGLRGFSDDLSYRPQVQERAKSVASFYNQSAIDAAAAKVS